MDTIVVGIDVSKDRLDVSVQPAGTALSYNRDAVGIEGLIEALAPLAPQLVAVEATGGFEAVVAASLAAAGLPVVVVNPAQVRSFADALGKRAKTDRIDAQVIAQFAAAANPPVRALPDAATQALADLVTRRRQIIQMIVAEGQREKRASVRARKSIQRLLKSLRAELSEIDAEIDESVRGSAIWREKENLLASVPGVGSGTARTMGTGFRTGQVVNPVDRGHIAFRTDDIAAFKKRLEDRGIKYSDYGGWAMSGWHQIFFYDPDGNVIEVHQAPPGTA